MTDGAIYLQPISVLKERGILTNVVRHEVALVFIHHKWGEKAPLWFAEGLAVYYSGEMEILKREIVGERPKIEGVEDIDYNRLSRIVDKIYIKYPPLVEESYTAMDAEAEFVVLCQEAYIHLYGEKKRN